MTMYDLRQEPTFTIDDVIALQRRSFIASGASHITIVCTPHQARYWTRQITPTVTGPVPDEWTFDGMTFRVER